ncbi:MAG: DUF599 domain-containing protein [Nisaea sp.]|jgi:uncharacterized membrane protein|uniref:DUF599 domain-containing protein n=1 Tax=Nisaea sp. TaxID=2024842 RepID=UPI001B03B48F|nr:DUF599 domain-containing protein [Nisaea sp.]MBO6559859.1 DUF599 domain-containing protein [Nisaea sp.]
MESVLEIMRRDDLIALALFMVCWLGYESFVAVSIRRGKGLPAAMQAWRRDWFSAAVERENRIIDVQIVRSLAGNSAFMASTSIFVVGGLAAVFGASEQVVAALNRFSFLIETSQDRFGLKIALLIFIFTFAFFRLAWSIRLHNNAAVVLGAIPQPEFRDQRETGIARAAVAAELASLAARHYNGGVHSYYFGLAVCTWFLHPFAFMAASLWVVAILYRREFRSRALRTVRRS